MDQWDFPHVIAKMMPRARQIRTIRGSSNKAKVESDRSSCLRVDSAAGEDTPPANSDITSKAVAAFVESEHMAAHA